MCNDGTLKYDGRFENQKAYKESFWLMDTAKGKQYEVWVFEFPNASVVQIERMNLLNGKSHMSLRPACMQDLYKATVMANGQPSKIQLGNVMDMKNILAKADLPN